MPKISLDKTDLAACRFLLRGGSKSFFAASLLLPPRIKNAATALYAFCRVADDLIDLGDDPKEAVLLLNARLDAAYAGTPHDDPIDRAFAAVVADKKIPKTLPAALIEGLAWDSEGRRYKNFESLLDYAARVAGAVGVMMALVMGVRDRENLARAADLGVAMQLTNIARDVGEDARAGRLFLPLDWFAQAGLDPDEFLKNPVFSKELAGMVERLLDEAEILYARAESGIANLPLDCRTGIAAARRIYAAIGHDVAARNFDSINRRARVNTAKKIQLAFLAAADAAWATAGNLQPALPANLFLLEGATDAAPDPRAFVKLLNLFERLERAQRHDLAEGSRTLA
jgi:phytoene synthase